MENLIIKSGLETISPQKLNLIASLARRQKLTSILDRFLIFSPNKGGRMLYKMFESAAKIITNEKKEINNFYCQKIEINQGPTRKKALFVAKGRTYKIRRRSSLIKIYLGEKNKFF